MPGARATVELSVRFQSSLARRTSSILSAVRALKHTAKFNCRYAAAAVTFQMMVDDQRQAELGEKLDRVKAFLDAERLGGLLLGTQRNFAWLSCGGDNHVGLATADGVAFLLVLGDGQRFVITANNERPRITEEELRGLGFEPIELPWFELRANPHRIKEAIAALVNPNTVGADTAVSDLPNVEARFAPLRYCLTDAEIERYRAHGRACAAAIEETAREIRVGLSEKEIESLLAYKLMSYGARPTVLLVAGDERFFKYRHPIPTERRLERYVCLSTCARRWGLTAAVTRLVHFGPVPDEIERRYRALLNVEAKLIAHTRPGAKSGELFDLLAGWYAAEGFEGEWRNHHQGGATGYLERDGVAYPGGQHIVQARQAFAWNPTIAGVKIEDTLLVCEASNEIITETGTWPQVEIEVAGQRLHRPQILKR
jgi:Xaa-Pro aminopeptidase